MRNDHLTFFCCPKKDRVRAIDGQCEVPSLESIGVNHLCMDSVIDWLISTKPILHCGLHALCCHSQSRSLRSDLLCLRFVVAVMCERTRFTTYGMPSLCFVEQ